MRVNGWVVLGREGYVVGRGGRTPIMVMFLRGGDILGV